MLVKVAFVAVAGIFLQGCSNNEEGGSHDKGGSQERGGPQGSGSKEEQIQAAVTKLQERIDGSPVFMVSRAWCHYCTKAKAVLDGENVPYDVLELDDENKNPLVENVAAYREAIYKLTYGWSVPKVWIDGKLLGGCDNTLEAIQSGKLKKFVAADNIVTPGHIRWQQDELKRVRAEGEKAMAFDKDQNQPPSISEATEWLRQQFSEDTKKNYKKVYDIFELEINGADGKRGLDKFKSQSHDLWHLYISFDQSPNPYFISHKESNTGAAEKLERLRKQQLEALKDGLFSRSEEIDIDIKQVEEEAKRTDKKFPVWPLQQKSLTELNESFTKYIQCQDDKELEGLADNVIYSVDEAAKKSAEAKVLKAEKSKKEKRKSKPLAAEAARDRFYEKYHFGKDPDDQEGCQENVGLSFDHIIADVTKLHQKHAQSSKGELVLFQVDSQFNCLEMLSESNKPEDLNGVNIYHEKASEGLFSSLAAPAASLYRNYFVHGDQSGQCGDPKEQVNSAEDVMKVLDLAPCEWEMRNGYLLPSVPGQDVNPKKKEQKNKMKEILSNLISKHDFKPGSAMYEKVKSVLKIGIQNVRVAGEPNFSINPVVQIFSSALPVAYAQEDGKNVGEPLAQCFLDATYEATLAAAALYTHMVTASKKPGDKNYVYSKSPVRPTVYLTAVGDGVAENHPEWIQTAIQRALEKHKDWPMDVKLVHADQRSYENYRSLKTFTGKHVLDSPSQKQRKKNKRLPDIHVDV